jgi:hypothetical protein
MELRSENAPRRMTYQRPEPIQAQIRADHPLSGLIEEAYQVFAYPKPRSMGVCEECCMDPKIEADFFNPSIRELPLHYVRDWYYTASLPKDVAKGTWAYLLPRILEILAVGEHLCNMGIEFSLNRFDTGNPENWSATEWSVLDNFQRIFLRSQMEQKRYRLDDIVCMFRLGGWSIEGLLDQVASVPDPILARRLWNDWCSWPSYGNRGILITAFSVDAEKTTVFDFYTSRTLYDRMEALALNDDTDGELAAKVSAVAGVIEANANWLP